MELYLLLSFIVGIVVIVVIIGSIIYKLYKSKESFSGAPAGYENMIITDDDGNLSTFAMSTLQTDIQSMINNSLNNSLNNYYIKSETDNKIANLQDQINTIRNRLDNVYAKSVLDAKLDEYVKYDDPMHLNTMIGSWYQIYASGNNVGYNSKTNESWYGGGTKAAPKKITGFTISKAPAWDGGSGTVWKN